MSSSAPAPLVVNTNNPVPVSSSPTVVASANTGGFFAGMWFLYVFLFVIIWFFAGVTGFVASLICLAYKGSMSDKIIGVLLAFLLGPVYWLYFGLNKSYCLSSSSYTSQGSEF